MNASKKRKLESEVLDEVGKRLKMTSTAGPSVPAAAQSTLPQPIAHTSKSAPSIPTNTEKPPQKKNKGKQKETQDNRVQESRKNHQRLRINKLNAPRPFPTVPTSVSATGPRSSHREGVNMICITRKTSLGCYMRRCKNVIIKDGYKTLHLSAMGAAIPLLMQLVCALPPILPFPQDEIHWEVTTGTSEVQDEVIPEDEDEDLSYQTRFKSTLGIVFKIGDGEFDGDPGPVRKYSAGKSVAKTYRTPGNTNSKKSGKGKATEGSSELVYEEPEQEMMDML